MDLAPKQSKGCYVLCAKKEFDVCSTFWISKHKNSVSVSSGCIIMIMSSCSNLSSVNLRSFFHGNFKLNSIGSSFKDIHITKMRFQQQYIPLSIFSFKRRQDENLVNLNSTCRILRHILHLRLRICIWETDRFQRRWNLPIIPFF